MSPNDELPGRILEFDTADGLGWISLDDGARVRFGHRAIGPHPELASQPGARVRVIGTEAGHGGVRKAVRVVPLDFVEHQPDMLGTLRALRLDPALAASDWPLTHRAIVEHYRALHGRPDIDRDRAVATTPRDDLATLRPVLERFSGTRIPADVRNAVTYAADVFAIRESHGDGSPDQLFALEGDTGTLYVVRTWDEREAATDADDIGTCAHPDTTAALNGIFRVGGLQPAFAEHAPQCEHCQAHMRECIAQFGSDALPEEFKTLSRGE